VSALKASFSLGGGDIIERVPHPIQGHGERGLATARRLASTGI
jgi:hypothetical protein